jgi:signal transduction histidine kinase/CheY-like chemotaxis protein
MDMWFSVSVYSPQKNHFVAVFDVVTDRKKAEAEKEKMQAQLFQAQKLESVGTLAGGIAHDFNNMLGAIKGYAELSLMDTVKSNPVYEYLKHIVTATDRAGVLTRQLLIFSRSHSAELQSLNLNENINNMLKMLSRLIGENIKIETKLAPDAAAIKADAGNIEQVLMNLCVNSRDAMPTGGKITIKTENVKVDQKYCELNIESRCGDFVMLTVSDTGTGMTKDVLSHMFEPFFTTKPQGKGTGLGLAVVYGIVKKHNGWINVYSEPGQGAVFKIYLPVSTEKPRPKSDTRIILPEQLKGRAERILVIEDDDGIRKLVTKALVKMNYQVFTAASGDEARALFDREKGDFHFILSDVVLPDTNGVDLCDELLNKNKNVCVLLSSGYASKGAYGDIIRDRKLPFIQKPYNLSVLFKTIREMLEGKA